MLRCFIVSWIVWSCFTNVSSHLRRRSVKFLQAVGLLCRMLSLTSLFCCFFGFFLEKRFGAKRQIMHLSANAVNVIIVPDGRDIRSASLSRLNDAFVCKCKHSKKIHPRSKNFCVFCAVIFALRVKDYTFGHSICMRVFKGTQASRTVRIHSGDTCY